MLPGVFVLAVATWLRWDGLARWSLDGDEIYSWFDVQRILAGGAWPHGARTHPLGYLGMAGMVSLFGLSEGVLRLVPAGCGLGAVVALLGLRRDALPRGVAWVAAGLAAITPWLVYASQTARFYAPQLLCATLATLLWLPGPGRRPRGALLALGAAVLCHPSAAFLAPVFVLPLFGPPVRWRALLGLLAMVAAVGGLLWVTDDGALAMVVDRVISGLDPTRYGLSHFVLGFGYNLGPVTGLLAGLGLVLVLTRSAPAGGPGHPAVGPDGAPPRFLAAALVVPPAILLVLAVLGISSHQRYATSAVPAAMLLAGWGVRFLWLRSRPAGVAALSLALAAHVPALLAYHGDGDRHDARLAAAVLAERMAPDDIVVVDEHATVELYLQRHPGLADVVTVEDTLLDEKKRSDFLANRHQVWVLLKSSRLEGGMYAPELVSWLGGGFSEVTRIGMEAPPLVRHDNRYVLFRRTRRVLGGRRRRRRDSR